VTGSPIQAHRTFEGTETACKALAVLDAEVEARTFEPSRATVGQLPDLWLHHVEAVGKARPRTFQEYRRKVDKAIRPAFESMPLRRLDPETLDAWYGRWLAQGSRRPPTGRTTPSSRRPATRRLSGECSTGAPTERSSPPGPRPPTMRVPMPAQLAALVEAAEQTDPVLAAAIGLAAPPGPAGASWWRSDGPTPIWGPGSCGSSAGSPWWPAR
jgi:Phage integrase, N-terminal SAM-like domain